MVDGLVYPRRSMMSNERKRRWRGSMRVHPSKSLWKVDQGEVCLVWNAKIVEAQPTTVVKENLP